MRSDCKPQDFPVSAEIVETYRQEGAVLVRGAFSDWVPRLKAAHQRLETRLTAISTKTPAGLSARIESPKGFPPLTFNESADGHFGIRNAAFFDEDFQDWMNNSCAASIVGQVTESRFVRFWWDQSFCKRSDATPKGATPWHTDSGSFSFTGQALPSLWIAGTEVTKDNSPILTVAGSHRDQRWFRPVFGKEHVKILPDNYAELDELLEVVARPDTVIRCWPMLAGDCLLIHPHTYHASAEPVRGSGERIGFTSRWLGDDVVWKPREMTFSYPDDCRFTNIVPGEPPPDADFPIVWTADMQASREM
ncbi:MAG: phytanoyl-CoA dioxygenase family protein [Gammaproteobacteria bacterium]|nr:phytanoyl-CoA dioxygenase family protein [Gammaproteobacteria bacterium]